MRNLAEFPITTEEIIACLEDVAKDLSYERTQLVGDLRPELLKRAIDIVSRFSELSRLYPQEKLDPLVGVSAHRCDRVMSMERTCKTVSCLERARVKDPEAVNGTCPDYDIVIALVNLIAHLRPTV